MSQAHTPLTVKIFPYWLHNIFNFKFLLFYVLINLIGPGIAQSVYGYGLDGPGIESRRGAKFSVPVQTGHGAHPASCTIGTGSFPGVKRPGLVCWVGPRDGLDVCEKSRSYGGSIPGPSSTWSVAIPTELPGQFKNVGAINIEQCNKVSINFSFVCSLYIQWKNMQSTKFKVSLEYANSSLMFRDLGPSYTDQFNFSVSGVSLNGGHHKYQSDRNRAEICVKVQTFLPIRMGFTPYTMSHRPQPLCPLHWGLHLTGFASPI
jgi:hypothetical protein